MKRTIKLAVAAAVALTSTAAFATNGDNLIATGAKSLGMGGTGIAHYNGAESATSNPALITQGKGTQFSFGGTYFTPDVTVKTAGTGGANDLTAESDAKHNIIPFVTLTQNLDNGFAVGVSMYGSAGMGTDWRSGNGKIGDASVGDMGLYSMRSNLMLLKFSVPVAYGQDNWSIGAAPVIMYGSLDMSFNSPDLNASYQPETGLSHDVGNGSSSDIGLGYEIGASYALPSVGVTAAVRYQSAIMMEYMDPTSTTAGAFGFGANAVPNFSDKLEQPSEFGIGFDWTQGDISLTADYKRINWGSAAGYSDFGWENQNVYALGAEYRMDKLALRAGYNYAKNPIKPSTDGRGVISGAPANPANPSVGPAVGQLINTLNSVMFPAITEKHYTIGAGYQFSKNVGADVSFMYATSPDVTVDASHIGLGDLTVTNDQMAVAANLNYKF
jgi:long-chain fatty acid transport protein